MDEPLSDQHRLSVVRAWRSARAAGERQSDFCARMTPPISTRTLRAWMRGFGVNGPPVEEARRAIDATIERLRQLQDLLPSPTSTEAAVLDDEDCDESSVEKQHVVAPDDEDDPPRPPATPAASQQLPDEFSDADLRPDTAAACGLHNEPPAPSRHPLFKWDL